MVQEILLGVFVGVVVSFLAIFLTKKLAMAEKTMEAERGALQEQIWLLQQLASRDSQSECHCSNHGRGRSRYVRVFHEC